MAQDWLRGMRDHSACGEPLPVPASAAHRTVRRVQAHSSPERERRRLIARKGLSEEAARQAIPDSRAQRLDLPYITLGSHSTHQRFHLFIEHGPLQSEASPGPFSAYGLSPTATLPWF
jgi:CRISPR-associated endonuclease Csy4